MLPKQNLSITYSTNRFKVRAANPSARNGTSKVL